jgi:molybdopterin molybdotransferase
MQRISRLTPLSEVLALIEQRVAPVPKVRIKPLVGIIGATLAADVVAEERPSKPVALREGFAVEAAAVADAAPYAPIPFTHLPSAVELGQPMPSGTDAIMPFDAVVVRGERAEAIGPVAPGEGVLPIGGDTAPGALLRRAGERVRSIDLAAFQTARIETVEVRGPRVGVTVGHPAAAPQTAIAFAHLLIAVWKDGGRVTEESVNFGRVLANENLDVIVAVGGTGSGERDQAVEMLAQYGSVEIHGIAISPGESAAIGFLDAKPVLLVPGRLDAALTAWTLIGRHLMAKLAGGRVEDRPLPVPLKRKVTSTIGLTELIPVRCANGMAEPLGSGYLSLTALAQSDGFIVVPADSEGFPADTQVAVTLWP